MYNSWIEKYDEIVEHRTDEEQLIKKQPVIAREYVEKNYIHKDKIKERINYLNSLYSDSDDYQRQFIIDIVSFLEELLGEDE